MNGTDNPSRHLVDALICCHQSQDPLPLWMAREAIIVIKAFFTGRSVLIKGKAFRGDGRTGNPVTRHRQSLIELARWEYVNELKERQKEFTESILYLSSKEKEMMSEFAKLIEKKLSLDQRYAVVVVQLALRNDPAKYEFEMMKTSSRKFKKPCD